jgi:hypothetical protein
MGRDMQSRSSDSRDLNRSELERLEEAGKRVVLIEYNGGGTYSAGITLGGSVNTYNKSPTNTNFFTRRRRTGLTCSSTGAGGTLGGPQARWGTVDVFPEDYALFRFLFGVASVWYPKSKIAVGVSTLANQALLNNTTRILVTDIPNFVGMVQREGDRTFQVLCNDGTKSEIFDLGPAFPCDTNSVDYYEFRLTFKFGVLFYTVRNLSSGAIAEGKFSIVPNTSALPLQPSMNVSNQNETTANAALAIEYSQIKIVTDY